METSASFEARSAPLLYPTEATDTSLERLVAIKVIREELAGQTQAANRFRREARTTAGFAHRHAVTVHDFGVASGGSPFLVMERLHGRSLRDALASTTRLGPTDTLAIMESVCAVVEVAHGRQLIHRDLKPANIFGYIRVSQLMKCPDEACFIAVSAYLTGYANGSESVQEYRGCPRSGRA